LAALPSNMIEPKSTGSSRNDMPEKTAALTESQPKKTGFSGNWIFNEEKSELDNWGAGNVPYKMELSLNDTQLDLVRSQIVEWGDDRITAETLFLDGRESHSEMWTSPMITTGWKSVNGDTVSIVSKIIFTRDGQRSEWLTRETWFVRKETGDLEIQQSSTTRRGQRQVTLVYDRNETKE
jgi:hypothetical protein